MSAANPRNLFTSCAQFDGSLKSGAMSLLDVARFAARMGLQGVEYRDVYWKDKAAELPAVRDLVGELGLKVTYVSFTRLYQRDPAKRQQLLQDVEDARALGSPLVRVLRGERPGDGPEDAAMRDGARAMIELAGSYGLRVALENYGGDPGGTLAEVKEALERLDSPVMGTLVDTANYARHGDDPAHAIRTLSRWVLTGHLKDAIHTPEGLKVTYPGNGTLDFPGIMAAFDAVGRDLPLAFEFRVSADPESDIRKSLEYLAKL